MLGLDDLADLNASFVLSLTPADACSFATVLVDLDAVAFLDVFAFSSQQIFDGAQLAALCEVVRVEPSEVIRNEMSARSVTPSAKRPWEVKRKRKRKRNAPVVARGTLNKHNAALIGILAELVGRSMLVAVGRRASERDLQLCLNGHLRLLVCSSRRVTRKRSGAVPAGRRIPSESWQRR